MENSFNFIFLGTTHGFIDDFAKQKDIELCSVFKIRTDNIILLKKEQKCDLVICLSHLGYKYTKEDADKISDLKV